MLIVVYTIYPSVLISYCLLYGNVFRSCRTACCEAGLGKTARTLGNGILVTNGPLYYEVLVVKCVLIEVMKHW